MIEKLHATYMAAVRAKTTDEQAHRIFVDSPTMVGT